MDEGSKQGLPLLHKHGKITSTRVSHWAIPITKVSEQTPKPLTNTSVRITLKHQVKFILNLPRRTLFTLSLSPWQRGTINTLPTASDNTEVMSTQSETHQRQQVRLMYSCCIIDIPRAQLEGFVRSSSSKGAAANQLS
jgi:hypothetical protein